MSLNSSMSTLLKVRLTSLVKYVVLTLAAIFKHQTDTWRKVYQEISTEEMFLSHFRRQIEERCAKHGIKISRFEPTVGHTDSHSVEWLSLIQDFSGPSHTENPSKPKDKPIESDDEQSQPW